MRVLDKFPFPLKFNKIRHTHGCSRHKVFANTLSTENVFILIWLSSNASFGANRFGLGWWELGSHFQLPWRQLSIRSPWGVYLCFKTAPLFQFSLSIEPRSLQRPVLNYNLIMAQSRAHKALSYLWENRLLISCIVCSMVVSQYLCRVIRDVWLIIACRRRRDSVVVADGLVPIRQ